jgi:hypothetical protein
MIDLIANTKPAAGHRDPPSLPSLVAVPANGQARTHDGGVLAALAVSSGTMLLYRWTHRRPVPSRVVGVGAWPQPVLGSLVQETVQCR